MKHTPDLLRSFDRAAGQLLFASSLSWAAVHATTLRTNDAENSEQYLCMMTEQSAPIQGEQVTVVICAYTEKRWDDLVAAVASVHRQRLQPGEVIVVIDHNPTMFRRAQHVLTSVSVIENTNQQGLSGARNSALACAKGEYIAFLDDDAVADPDWLVQLCAPLQDGQIAGVGGRILPRWEAGKPAWFPEEFNWVVGCTYRGMPEHAVPVRNLIGASMLFRHEVFRMVGGFSHGIGRIGTRPLGCEETELCIRAAQHSPGLKFLYVPTALISHWVPASRGTLRYFLSRCYAEGLSKALVTRLVGANDGLTTERAYTQRVLPRGVLRGLVTTVRQRNLAGVASATAIILGLAVTTAGYVIGLLTTRLQPAQQQAADGAEQRYSRSG